MYDDSFYGLTGFNDLSKVAEEQGVCFAYSTGIDYDNPHLGNNKYRKIAKDLISKTSANGGKNLIVLYKLHKFAIYHILHLRCYNQSKAYACIPTHRAQFAML